jgi:hypothetical protein
MRTVVINVREYGGSYIARAVGLGISASCTSAALWAVERCALKCKLGRGVDAARIDFQTAGIALKNTTKQTYLAEWDQPAADSKTSETA